METLRYIAVSALLAAYLPVAEAQTPTYSILHVEFVNSTLYEAAFCGPSDRGKNPNKLPTAPNGPGTGIADIVSVNGQPVRGTAIEIISSLFITSTAFSPGLGIVDFAGAPPATSWDLAFLNPDNSVIGTLHIDGSGGGPPPPRSAAAFSASRPP